MRPLFLFSIALLCSCERVAPVGQPAPNTLPVSAPTSAPVKLEPTTPEASLAPAPTLDAPDVFTERRLYAIKARASSFLDDGKPRAFTRYHPNYAFDDNPATAWNEGSSSSGAGEYLEVKVPRAEGVTQLRVLIKNGFQKPAKLFSQNARVKTLRIELPESGDEITKELPDSAKEQEIVFSVKAEEVTRVKFVVLEVYEGSKFADLSISDIQLFVTAARVADASHNRLAEIEDWIDQQRFIAQENKQLTALGIPLLYEEEPLSGELSPFSPEDERFIERAKSVLEAKKVVPVETVAKAGSTPEQYADGLLCDAFEREDDFAAEDKADPFDEYEEESREGDAWLVPCLEAQPGIRGYQLSKTTAPSRDDWSISYWSEPNGYQSKEEVRAVRVRGTYDDRTGTPAYEVLGAVAFDARGYLRAYVNSSSRGGFVIRTFMWRAAGTRDILLGGYKTSSDGTGKLSSARLTPVGIPLPKELELDPASQPTSVATSQASTQPSLESTTLPIKNSTTKASTQPAP